MALHLNWDNNQSNGIIFNGTYTGALFTGANLKPNIGIPYDSMQYSEVFEGLNYVEVNNVKTVMLPAQEAIIIALAIAWVQELGQEGNPSPEQIAEAEALATRQELLLLLENITVKTLNGNTFDGDAIARQDMLSAIDASDLLGITENNWKLADNTFKVIGLAELREAHALAIKAKGTILGA